MTLYDARDLAIAWLSVSTASDKDKLSPSTRKTVLIEQFFSGVRLVALDGYTLLTSWVPNLDHPDSFDPDFDLAPLLTAVAMDGDGRCRSLMAHALQLADRAAEADESPVEVRLRLGIVDLLDDDDRPTLEGLEPEVVTIEVPERERLKLRTYDGEFPTWRTAMVDWSPFPAQVLAVPGDRFAILGKLAKYHTGPIGLRFGGPDRPVRIDTLESWPEVSGLVMPVKWDIEKNEPWEPTDDEVAEAVVEWGGGVTIVNLDDEPDGDDEPDADDEPDEGDGGADE